MKTEKDIQNIIFEADRSDFACFLQKFKFLLIPTFKHIAKDHNATAILLLDILGKKNGLFVQLGKNILIAEELGCQGQPSRNIFEKRQNKSKGENAYTVVDVSFVPSNDAIARIAAVEGARKVRVIV